MIPAEPQGFYNDHQLSHNLGILYPNPVAPPLQAMPLPVHISSGYVTVPTNSSYSTASTMNWRAQFDTFYPNDPERKRQLLEVLSSKWYAYEGGSREPLHALRPFIDEKSTNEFECSVCLKVLPRLDRAEDHFRTHIRHRPFQCIGKCGKLNWSALRSLLCAILNAFISNIRFYTKGALEAHERIGEKRTVCGTWYDAFILACLLVSTTVIVGKL